MPEIKEIRPEYNDIYSQVLQGTLKRVDKEFKNFFRQVKKGEKAGYPRFQGYNRYNSFCYHQIEKLKGNPTVRIENGEGHPSQDWPYQGEAAPTDGGEGRNMHD